MRFGSVCSGIEAASVAWHPLGWKAAWLAEIEPFPCGVLAHHYPAIPNLGDMTAIARRVLTGEVEAPDVLTGGTPCQAFSVAGLRESLADSRGNLTLKFVELADAIDHVRSRGGKPASVVIWENVPGVLSTKDNAFGCFLAGLAGEDEPLEPPGGRWSDSGCVYGPARAVAWRTLDAQFFGLAQRRRRVFVVASARAGFDPAQVLFEWQGVRRDTAPSREAGQGAARGVEFGPSGGGFTDLNPTLDARAKDGPIRNQLAGAVLHQAFGGNNTSGPIDCAAGLNAKGGAGRMDFDSETFIAHAPEVAATMVARSSRGAGQTNSPGHNADEELVVTHSLRGEGFDASEDGTGRGTPLVPVTFRADAMREGTAKTISPDAEGRMRLRDPGMGMYEDIAPTLDCGAAHGVAHAFDARQSDVLQYGDISGPMDTGFPGPTIQAALQVRRLTPRECERLQGFEPDYTLIPWRGKAANECPDGPRYKALGNSWAVPVARWVGMRVALHLEAA